MGSKLVSVIVLNFNGEKIIRKCLDHLLNQTYPNFEIIVVDNGSSDASLTILEEYLRTGKVSVIRSTKNLGVPGGRNLGLLYVNGEIVAFIDNDGYADKNWLKEAVQTLESDGRIGAVASVVFFAKRKIILNGAGGTLNFQGYGGDIGFNAPYEFAEIPQEVLYPMGCGMVVKKKLMDLIGPLDSVPFKWYDDTELGIRLWKLGCRVVVSPNAWVDHDMGYSDQFLPDKIYLCERARIRTVLKYYPARQLLSWFLHEWYFLRYFKSPSLWSVPLKAWTWNLFHLPSALKWRFRFAFKRNSFWHLLHPSWRSFPPPTPNNQAYRPDPKQAGDRLILDGKADGRQLNFGWYSVELDGSIHYRWTEAYASAFVRFLSPVQSLSIKFRVPEGGSWVNLIIRRLGEIEPVLDIPIHASTSSWQEKVYQCDVGTGTYELLLLAKRIFQNPSERTLGIAVSFIKFD